MNAANAARYVDSLPPAKKHRLFNMVELHGGSQFTELLAKLWRAADDGGKRKIELAFADLLATFEYHLQKEMCADG